MSIALAKSLHSTMVACLLQIVLVFAMTLPMLILYATSTLGPLMSLDLHFEPTLLGYLIMSSFGLAAVLSLWAGVIVDYIGSRTGLWVLFYATATAFTLIAAAETFVSLIIAAAICGIAQALANPVTNLLIAQQIQPDKKAKVVGLKQAGVQLAALFAGLVLPAIAFQYGWRTAFGCIVPAALLFGIAAFFIVPKQSAQTSKRLTFSYPNSLLRWLMGIQFCVGLALSAFVTFLPTFATQQGMPLLWADMLIAVFGIMGMLSRILLTPMGAKLKDESVLLFALIAIAACAMAITMQTDAENHWRLWIGAVGMGLSAVGTNAIAMSMLVRDPAFGPVATASSLVSFAFFGGFALGPPLYAALSQYSGSLLLGWSTLISVLCAACVMTVILASARRHKRQVPT
ncbi:MFS transporter [Nitrosomonas sp. Nm166]|uniref:MFS transporter n=1 Tax=Nitrosomonas sp. Nm166 TaxID=1881054 RepID=UPI0008E47761|nr:MFS transporter [Nitrosomonas sp. Nm166]SFE34583.1 Predicted arabinose efflux permease, MFS family [Nitrosomonas sp. Nm166]